METRQIPEEADEEDCREQDPRSVHGERVAEFPGEAAAAAVAAPRARKAQSSWTAAGAAFLLQTPSEGSRVAATQTQALPRPLPPLAGRGKEEGEQLSGEGEGDG